MRDGDDFGRINGFKRLIDFLRDALDWPIEGAEDWDDVSFEFDPAEDLGLDPDVAAKIKSIRQLRPLPGPRPQPFGIFFIEFDRKRLPVVALRRILGKLVTRKRESANPKDRKTWHQDDLLFVSACGEDTQRRIEFAHFGEDAHNGLPILRVLGWDADDTLPKLDWVEAQLREKLYWPDDVEDDEWREQWRGAFTLRHREAITTSKQLAVRLADLARGIRR